MGEPAINIDDLSPDERLRLLERIWESLSAEPQSLPLTGAQREELDRRLEELGESAEGIAWDEVRRQIR